MIQNLIFGIIFWKYFFRAYNFFIIVQKFRWISSPSFSNFRFFSINSQSQAKLAKRITHFTIQFRSKNHNHFMNLMKIICSRNTAKNLWLYKCSSVSEKNICSAPFLDAQELHSWRTLKAMSVYLRKKIFLPKTW